MTNITPQFQLDQNFDYRFLRNKREQVSITIQDTDAATAANYGVFFIALAPGYLEEVWESHKTAGSDAGAVTVTIEKLATGVALDSGTAMLTAALSLKSTANTPQQGTVSQVASTRQFVRGDRLALKDAGALTAVAHVTVSLFIRYRN